MNKEELIKMELSELEELQMEYIERIENVSDEERRITLENMLELIESEISSRAAASKNTAGKSTGLLREEATSGKSTGLLRGEEEQQDDKSVQQRIEQIRSEYAYCVDAELRYRQIKKAAYLGDPESLYNLARLYEIGRGVKKDHSAALRFYSRAAQKGCYKAYGKIGYFYENGMVVEASFEEAEKNYLLAFRNGHDLSGYMLARLYESNKFHRQDYDKAMAIYSGLGAKGYADAIFRVAMMYEYGRGVNRNLLIAQGYYQEAIAKGDLWQKKKYKNYYKLFLRRNSM